MALERGAMTDAMESAYKTEWEKVKPNPLPDTGKEDRRLIFAAVARGLLDYLAAHPAEILKSLTTKVEGGNELTVQVTRTEFDIGAG